MHIDTISIRPEFIQENYFIICVYIAEVKECNHVILTAEEIGTTIFAIIATGEVSMICFRNFTVPLWEIFVGNLLLLFCSLFYLAWWIVSYRPDSSDRSAVGGFYIAAAFITGISASVLMSIGIYSLSYDSKGLPVWYILIGGLALFLVLLPLTAIVFHRSVTSELIIMHIWVVLELSAIAMLYGRFGTGLTISLAALVGIAFVVGLICYMLYYRLDKTTSYWIGIIPLATDAFVMAVFLVVLAIK